MKRFDDWNEMKKWIHEKATNFYVSEREVWFVHLGTNVGFEEDGKGGEFKRPVLVLKKIGNMFSVLPMTSKGKDSPFYFRLPDMYFNKPSRVILSQGKAIDKSRFIDKIGMLSEWDFNEVKEKLKALML